MTVCANPRSASIATCWAHCKDSHSPFAPHCVLAGSGDVRNILLDTDQDAIACQLDEDTRHSKGPYGKNKFGAHELPKRLSLRLVFLHQRNRGRLHKVVSNGGRDHIGRDVVDEDGHCRYEGVIRRESL